MPLSFLRPPRDAQAALAGVALLQGPGKDWLRWPRLSVTAVHPWCTLDVGRLSDTVTLADVAAPDGWQGVGLAEDRPVALLRTLEVPLPGTSRTWNVPAGRRWGPVAGNLAVALDHAEARAGQAAAAVVAVEVPVLGMGVLWLRGLGGVVPFEGLAEPWLPEPDFLDRVRAALAAVGSPPFPDETTFDPPPVAPRGP